MLDLHTAILKNEMVLAIGCTEPTAIALAAAKARAILGTMPEKIEVYVSGNMLKNSAGVVVPNSGGMKGVNVAATIGVLGADHTKNLEALQSVTTEHVKQAHVLLENNFSKMHMTANPAKLYVKVIAYNGLDMAWAVIKDRHDNFFELGKNNQIIDTSVSDANSLNAKLNQTNQNKIQLSNSDNADDTDQIEALYEQLSICGIYEFITQGDLGEIRARIEQQIELNTLASEEGLTTNYGLNVGKTILKYSNPNDVWIKAKAHAAAGSDARMGGSVLPVMTICGSGNQGITACVPLVVYAQAHNIEHEQLIKAIALSNLVAIHIKHHMGRLSAFCGVMTAGMGVSAGLTFLSNGTLREIEETVQNIIGDISGVFCDGAKPTCATKIASSIDAAFQAHYLVKDNNMINSDMGIISAHNVEQTIRNIGKIGGEAMNNTDQAICDIMAKRI